MTDRSLSVANPMAAICAAPSAYLNRSPARDLIAFKTSAPYARTSDGLQNIKATYVFMSSLLLKLMCVRAVSVGKRATRPFGFMQATHRTHPACLSSHVLPCGHDAAHDGARSGLRGEAVGGSFLHAPSVFFFSTFETATDRNTPCHLL